MKSLISVRFNAHALPLFNATIITNNRVICTREDLDSLIEVSLWPGQRDAFQFVDAKVRVTRPSLDKLSRIRCIVRTSLHQQTLAVFQVKAAFTRSYNKNCTSVPYAMHGPAPKKKTAQASQDEGFAEEDAPEENSDDGSENADADRMIKAKKPTGSNRTQPTSKKEKASKRGRGRGKPK